MANREDPLPIVLLGNLLGLAAHFGWGFLRFQARRKRGVRAFRNKLLRSGMPREHVEALAQAYHVVGSVRHFLHTGLARLR